MSESTLKLTDFAPELLHCVFRFCSRRDLASLSRVNYTFRQAAEYLLHRHVHISLGFPKRRPCLQATRSLFCNLTSNPQKAALLRYVHVKLAFDGDRGVEQSNDRLLKQIVDALRNAHGLEDLRIIVMLSETMFPPSDPCKGMLSELIKGGYFQLHTLYCDSYQDLEGIIVSQKHLRLLGIYTHKYRPGYVNVSKLINNSRIDSNRKFPGIFMLYCSHITGYINHLTLFPEFCLPGQTLTLCRDIATFLSSNYETAPVDDRRLTVHIFDSSYAKTAVICEVVEVMAQYFVNCDDFTMWVQTSVRDETVSKPWRISGLSTSINRFKKLQYLNFYVSSDASNDSLCEATFDLKSLLLEEFVHAVGLKLVQVCVDDYYMIARIARLAADIRNRSWKVEIQGTHNDDLWNPNTQDYDEPPIIYVDD